MSNRKPLVVVLFAPALLVYLLCHAAAVRAQEGHQPQHTHMHDPSEKLGRVNFTVSCTPQRPEAIQSRSRLAPFVRVRRG